MNDIIGFDLYFPRESLKAALIDSFLSVSVLVGIFSYLNRYTKRRYFSFWTVAWLFHAIWLGLCIASVNVRETPSLIMMKQWCIGASAVFLLWGSASFLRQRTKPSQLALFLAFLFLWGYVGAYQLDSPLQTQLPVFVLVGLASLMTGWCFFKFRAQNPFLGAGLLACGFALWGIYIGAYPFFQGSDQLISSGYFISAVLQLFIAVSMIILALEEVRHTNHRAFQRIRTYKTKTDFLQKKVLSTEERYRSLFDQASEGIVIADAEDLRILELNQTAKRLLGINHADSNALSSFCQLHPEPQPSPQTGPEWFAAICRHRHLNLVRRDGGATPTEADGAPISFEGRAAYQFFLRELTERARLEQQLRQAEKLSALGQMISGVAHELNNPLAVIKGYLELILRRDELKMQTRTDLEKVANESNRAAKLVNNFLSFAREQPTHREAVDLNELVKRVAELRRLDLQNSRVELRLHLDPELPSTHADPDQIQQVLVNLLNNSIHALSETPRPGRVQISTQRKEDTVKITVEDNGPGVPPEVLPYIFEPFFTTKDVGKGTGLGLSIAHSILADHGGRIAYEPSAIGGAGFVLELPVVSPDIEADSPAQPAVLPACNDAPAERSARILVLDDEQAIAELLGEMLGLLGHSTTLCHAPMDALEMIERREFDLIISDFRMPKMNGQEFYHHAVQKKPELARRVVFLTGDVVNEETQAFLQSTGNPHLSKPFQLARVERIVEDMLQQNAAVP
ncbi:MAG TPA: ATP-binding protein [Candidatus Angelobacter sp.]|nr:ATP-binding protein [Candidatus Angelobacter sp.]